MEKHDLPAHQTIYAMVLQPQTGATLECFGTNDFKRVLRTDLRPSSLLLAHVGDLRIMSGPVRAIVEEYAECGGETSVVSGPFDSQKFVCKKCGHEALFAGGALRTDLFGRLLDLLLKQVVPRLPSCNYFYDESLGMVALDINGLTANPQELLVKASNPAHCYPIALGFVLKLHMETLEDAGDYAEWMKCLIVARSYYLRDVLDRLYPLVLGPKPINQRTW